MLKVRRKAPAGPLDVRGAHSLVSLPRSLRTGWTGLVEALRGAAARLHWPVADLAVVLGTARTRVLGGSQVRLDEPSFIALDLQTGRFVAVGEQARGMHGRTPPHLAVIRPLREGVVADFEAATHLVRRFLKQAFGFRFGFGPTVVVAVSSGSTRLERQTLGDALRAGGARRVIMVDQTVAAAIGAGLALDAPRGSLVIHLGGGSTEVAVTALGGVALTRTIRIAGDDMDRAICAHLRRRFGLLIGERSAETLKRTLGCALPVDPPQEALVGGRDLVSGMPVRVKVTSSDIHEALQKILETTAHQVRQVLEAISPELLADVVRDGGVVLAGGGALLRRLDDFLAARTGLPCTVPPQPDTCVDRGLQQILRSRHLLRAARIDDRAAAPVRAVPRRLPGQAMAVLLLAVALGLTAYEARPVQAGQEPPLASRAQRVVAPLLTGTHRLAVRVEASSRELLHLGDESAASLQMPAMALQLEEEQRQVASLSGENGALRRLLKLRGQLPQQALAGQLLVRDTTGWLSTLTLASGRRGGVRRGMAVVAPDGLVGEVTGLTADTSQVRLVTSPNAVVACRIRGRNEAGVLYGNGGSACEMRYLDPDALVRVGDVVETSGQDGVYPEGLRVGSVRAVAWGRDNAFRVATVVPSANLARTRDVLLLAGNRT